VNKCCVYALFDYEAQNSDEISFREGDLLSIQRKNENGDEHWWIALVLQIIQGHARWYPASLTLVDISPSKE